MKLKMRLSRVWAKDDAVLLKLQRTAEREEVEGQTRVEDGFGRSGEDASLSLAARGGQ